MIPPPTKPPEPPDVGLPKRYATRKGSEVTNSVGKVLEKAGVEWVIGKLNIFPNPMGLSLTRYFDRDPENLIFVITLVGLTQIHFTRKLTATCVYTSPSRVKNVSNQLLPTFQISNQSISNSVVRHSSQRESSHPLDWILNCEVQSQPSILINAICVLGFNGLTPPYLFPTLFDESTKDWSKFHLQLMLQQFHHAYTKHFYFTTRTSHGTSYFNFLSSSIGHASRSGKIGLIEEKLQNLEIPILLGGHSIGSVLSMEMIKKSPEKLKHCVKLYPFLAFNSHSATQLVINANVVIKSQIVIVSFSYLVTSPGLLPSEALSLVIMESGSANAVEVAYCSLPQYHARSGVFYMAISEFQRISKIPEWITMREREDAQFLSSCVKNMLTHVLTLLDITSYGCSWFLKGNFNFLSIVMRCMNEYSAAANMGVDLKLSFSYAAKITKELWMSCIKGIGIAGTVLTEFLILSYSRTDTYCSCDSLMSMRKLFEGLQVVDIVWYWKKEVTSGLSALFIGIFAADDDSAKGIVMLVENAENVALTILNAANEPDCLLAKKVTDDEIFFYLLVVESNCSMPSNNVYRWSGIEEMLPYTTMWNSLVNEFAQQGMCVEVLKYFRNMRFLVHICSRLFMSWFIACADLLVLPNGKEVNGCSLRSLVDRNHLFSPALIEMLRQFWNTVMGTLRRMNPMALTICNYCWSDLLVFHGLLNFVFDRGKVMWKQLSTLRTRLF
ncbi:alpha/beta-Hydrolases superfamily protein [Trifolium repens]|nr:alpha/beta-Hydrolases superfamily protein [Trifolium repens]